MVTPSASTGDPVAEPRLRDGLEQLSRINPREPCAGSINYLRAPVINAREAVATRRLNMRKKTMRKAITLGAVVALMTLAGSASAAEIEVKMLDKGADGVMVFEPALVKIEPGDTIKFVSTNKGHNAETIKGMLPEGTAPFVGKVNQDIAVTFDKPGVYGVKCLPHYGMGMVALVVVGSPVNKDEAMAVTHPGKAKQVFAMLFGKLDAARTASK
jgi:pseudoazurin